MSEATFGTFPLIDAAALAARLGDPALRIVDARFAPPTVDDPGAGRRAHAAAHLPGATYADLNRDLSDLTRRGQGRHPLPDSEAFAAALGRWGIAPDSRVVVYDAGDGSMAAARLWWMLHLFGHRQVAVLDGGLAAWRAAGLPEAAGGGDGPAAVAPYPSRFAAQAIVTTAEVVERLETAPGWLWDARAAERFRGEVEPVDPVAGHVPGALNRPLGLNLREGRLRPADELRAELQPLLQGRPASDIVLMCGSGVTACHLLLAMAAAGLPGGRVYAASWSGWIEDRSRPVAAERAE